VVDETDVVVATLANDGRPPGRLGISHWSARFLAAELDISFASVARIWRKWDIQPHRIEGLKFSTDPEREPKIRDVVGLYLDPPDNAVVVSVDEKSQIEALDRTAPPDDDTGGAPKPLALLDLSCVVSSFRGSPGCSIWTTDPGASRWAAETKWRGSRSPLVMSRSPSQPPVKA
jgi:hypothetical protein